MLATFVRLAITPSLVPSHWHSGWRLTVMVLRCALLVPAVPAVLALVLGGLALLARFAQRCGEVQAVERENLARSRWFNGVMQACNTIVGFSSFGLFIRLYLDHRRR